jgi:hypothetical protein
MKLRIFKSGLYFALFVLLSIGVFINPLSAGDVNKDVSGHTYSVMVENVFYDLTFVQGPFGPGPGGTVTLLQDGTILNTYSFMCYGDIIEISGFGNFFYGNYQIVYVPGSTVLLLGCKDCVIAELDQK